jgi:hypothetical protein
VRQSGPYRWLAPFALGAVLLSGCATRPAPPPPLTEADLHDAVATDMLGEVPAKVDVVRRFADPPETCVDLHHGQTSFGQFASSSKLARVLMRLSLRGGLTHWRRPGLTDYRPIDAEVERRLASVSAAAILEANRARQTPVADKPWPARCTRRYWLAAPLYQDDVAFVARGTGCEGLCGSSVILALEFHDGRWRVIGVHDTWTG